MSVGGIIFDILIALLFVAILLYIGFNIGCWYKVRTNKNTIDYYEEKIKLLEEIVKTSQQIDKNYEEMQSIQEQIIEKQNETITLLKEALKEALGDTYDIQ